MRNEPPSLRHSRKFWARAVHYHSLALAEPDERHAEILFDISALFLKMATYMADREMVESASLPKRHTDAVHMTDGIWRKAISFWMPIRRLNKLL